jgi:hypothetical protein
MNKDQTYKAIPKDYLSHDPFEVYKCYQSDPHSGDIFLDECEISCAISNPFSKTIEYFTSYDCFLMTMVM